MKDRLFRALVLTLSLLICTLPVLAHAEGAPPSADHLNMTNISIGNIRYDDGSGEKTLPLSFDLTFGYDLPARRALALVSIGTAGDPFTFMGSIENEEIRARFAGLETGLVLPLEKAEDELIRSSLLMGLEDDELSEETRAALEEYLTLMEEAMNLPAEVIDSDSLFEAMYPIDEWRKGYEDYPALMKAEPAGEEDVTLFGTVYTAKKYTYSLENVSEEEYDDFFKAYEDYFSGPTSELDAAYDRLWELVLADWEAAMEKTDVWKDDGSLQQSESGSLSEWDEAGQQGYLCSIQGVIWQVEEVMGTIEEYTYTMRGAEGEYTVEYHVSDMHDGRCMRTESSSTQTDPYFEGSVSSAASLSVQAGEAGAITAEGSSLTGVDYSQPDYAFTSAAAMNWRGELTGDRLLITMEESASGSDQADEFMSLTADFALGEEEETGLLNRASGTITSRMDMLGMAHTVSMDAEILLSTLPEGTLLPMTIDAINPFEAGEEVMNQLAEDLNALLMRIVASFIPEPEAPPSIGGALIG